MIYGRYPTLTLQMVSERKVQVLQEVDGGGNGAALQ